MATLNAREKSGLKSILSKMAYTLTGSVIHIRDAENGELGYTTGKDNSVYINFHDNEVYNRLNKPGTIRMIRGIFFHEILHILRTDFGTYFGTINSVKSYEQEILGDIYNILEDSSIENFAPLHASDELVSDLNYMRAIFCKQAPRIEENTDPFSQFITASIQYGDSGLLKGSFTFDEAHDCFVKCIPIMDKAVIEPDNLTRSKYAMEIFNLSEPLWRIHADAKAMEEMMNALRETLKGMGKGISGSRKKSGDPLDLGNPDETVPESTRSKRRKITFRRVSPEEYKKAMEEAAKSGSSGDTGGDIEVLIPDGPVEAETPETASGIPIPVPKSEERESSPPDTDDESSTAATDAGEKEDTLEKGPAEKGGSSIDKDAPKSDDEKTGSSGLKSKAPGNPDAKDGEENHSEGNAPSTEGHKRTSKSPPKSADDSKVNGPPSGDAKIPSPTGPPEPEPDDILDDDIIATLEEEGAISAETAASLLNELSEADAKIEADDRRESKDSKANFDYKVGEGYNKACKGRKCINTRQKISLADELKLTELYDEIVAPMMPGINKVTRQLARIFKNDMDEKMFRTSGRISFDRLRSGKKTARVFVKNKVATKSDMYVCIAADCSGSTRGEPIKQVRNAAIALAEVFAKLDIPISIFGFTADDVTSGNPHHIHFITGANTKRDRLRLLGIKALDNNFDGYSIRYGAELLKKKPATHKMLIVISDGNPLCDAYDTINGVFDTKLAIKESSKSAVTFGILVGNEDVNVHKEMYGQNFMHIKIPSDLFDGLARCISKQVKAW